MEMTTGRWHGCALTVPCAEERPEASTRAVARARRFPEIRVACNQHKTHTKSSVNC